jgi:hypothetical protein
VIAKRLVTSVLVLAACRDSEMQAPSTGSFAAVSFAGCEGVPSVGITVGSTDELNAALAAAGPGDVIRLAPSTTYTGTKRVTNRSGTGERPIVVCGDRSAVWTGDFRADGMNWWVFQGFTIRDAFQAFHAKRSSHNRLQGLEIYNVGQEGIHWLCSSVGNVVQENWIHDTGTGPLPEFGEAVYLGTHPGNLETACGQSTLDRSDSNRVIDNQFGPNVRSEDVDAKEGTRWGVIARNQSDGRGKVSIPGRFSSSIKVQQQTQGYRVNRNRIDGGAATSGGTVGDAILLLGGSAVARRNEVRLGPATGYALRVRKSGGNIVYCDNIADPPSRLSNVPCTP